MVLFHQKMAAMSGREVLESIREGRLATHGAADWISRLVAVGDGQVEFALEPRGDLRIWR